ncbi:MAG: type II toxin-antitoxin system PemK/MazF family toxin [Nitrospira sp. SB0675_bin_23]|nr:type II toxin-antitoxin system PemK/MazF family toxin [Nitrospira sp. SB0675_bin_23]
MDIKRGFLYIIDFNPPIKTKPGKLRPGLVLQSDLVTDAGYPSTIVVPATTKVVDDPGILRLRVNKGQAGLKHESDLLLGQLIAVSNESFRQELKRLPSNLMDEVIQRIRILLSL